MWVWIIGWRRKPSNGSLLGRNENLVARSTFGCEVREDLKLEKRSKAMENLEEMALDSSRWRLWTALCARASGKD